MTTLVYSDKCPHCLEIFQFIQSNPVLDSLIRVHDIRNGVPDGVKQVPSLITAQGTLYSGTKQVKTYLQSLLPLDIKRAAYSPNVRMSRLDNNNTTKYFNMSDFGKVTTPVITPELQRKIDAKVDQSLSSLKGK